MNQDEQALYRRFAHLYDRIYDWKDYAAEAERVRTALLGAGVREGGRVVEAACGTGSYLVHLNDWYEVSGFDLNPAVLEVARKKIPKVHLFEADMADFELTRPVDAIVCLFSSIGYVPLGEPLRAVAESFYRNVLPGGVVLQEDVAFRLQLRLQLVSHLLVGEYLPSSLDAQLAQVFPAKAKCLGDMEQLL